MIAKTSRPRWDYVKYWVILVFLSLLGVYLAVGLFSATRFSISAFEIDVELIPFQSGKTVVFLPPVGELSAVTHRFPFLLQITLLNVDLDLLVLSLENLAISQDNTFFEEQLREKLGFFMLRLTLLSFVCGAGAVFLIARAKRALQVLQGGMIAALLFLTLAGVTFLLPYDIDAFEQPQYKGALGAAPWMVDLADLTLGTIKALGDQLEIMTGNLHDLSMQLDQVSPTAAEGEEGLRVLHVSDIHNNPAAVGFIERVVSSFEIDLIIDTGDLTDYGTELEMELVESVTSLPVPYLFIPGNHDSPWVSEIMRRNGAIVLENEIVEINGLRVAGIADPSSSGPLMEVASERTLREASSAAYHLFAENPEPPDVAAVHHPLMGEPFLGKVPVILSGHTHRAQVDFRQGSALVNAGTTGAAGLRGLNSPHDIPYSVAVIYFNRNEEDGLTMVMVDLISVQQFQDSFTLHRYYNR